eukprot:Em0020g722a
MNQQLKTQHKTWQEIKASLQDAVSVIQALENAAGVRCSPKYSCNPRFSIQRVENWMVACTFMKNIGVDVNGFKPDELASGSDSAICNMFRSILKWQQLSVK